MVGVALRARPLPHVKRQTFEVVTAGAARLATREEPVDFDEGPPIPRALVLELSEELPPGGVGDVPGEPTVAHHPGDIQALNHDRLVLADEASAEPVEEVGADVGHALVDLGDGETGFCAVM